MAERSVAIFDRSKMVEKMTGLFQLRPAETAIVIVDMHRGHRDPEVATKPAKAEDRARAMADEKRALNHARGRRDRLIDVILMGWTPPGTEGPNRMGRAGRSQFCNGVYCVRGQSEDLIKQHRFQHPSGCTSCQSPRASQFRQVLYIPAYWLMLALRDTVPRSMPLRRAEFATVCQSSRSTPGWSRGPPASASPRPVPTPPCFACWPEPCPPARRVRQPNPLQLQRRQTQDPAPHGRRTQSSARANIGRQSHHADKSVTG